MSHLNYLFIFCFILVNACVVPMPIELDENEENFAPSYDPVGQSKSGNDYRI